MKEPRTAKPQGEKQKQNNDGNKKEWKRQEELSYKIIQSEKKWKQYK